MTSLSFKELNNVEGQENALRLESGKIFRNNDRKKTSKATFKDALKKAASNDQTTPRKNASKSSPPSRKNAAELRTDVKLTGIEKSGRTLAKIKLTGTEKTADQPSPDVKEAAEIKEKNAVDHRSDDSLFELQGKKKNGLKKSAALISKSAEDDAPLSSRLDAESIAAGFNDGKDGQQVKKGRNEKTRELENTKKFSNGEQSIIKLSNLTDNSRRVEVIDRRVLSSQKVAESRQRNHRKKAAGSGADLSGTLIRNSGDSKFAILETEINIPRSFGNRTGTESIAEALSRKLDNQSGNEIVQQVKLLLNRAESGEIRINLKPDSLGRVRVNIQMENNRLSGRVLVESAAARNAFRSSLDNLQAKLIESGFNDADLTLTWDDRSNQHPGQGGRFANRDSSGDIKKAIQDFEVLSAGNYSVFEGQIDMVV